MFMELMFPGSFLAERSAWWDLLLHVSLFGFGLYQAVDSALHRLRNQMMRIRDHFKGFGQSAR